MGVVLTMYKKVPIRKQFYHSYCSLYEGNSIIQHLANANLTKREILWGSGLSGSTDFVFKASLLVMGNGGKIHSLVCS